MLVVRHSNDCRLTMLILRRKTYYVLCFYVVQKKNLVPLRLCEKIFEEFRIKINDFGMLNMRKVSSFQSQFTVLQFDNRTI